MSAGEWYISTVGRSSVDLVSLLTVKDLQYQGGRGMSSGCATRDAFASINLATETLCPSVLAVSVL